MGPGVGVPERRLSRTRRPREDRSGRGTRKRPPEPLVVMQGRAESLTAPNSRKTTTTDTSPRGTPPSSSANWSRSSCQTRPAGPSVARGHAPPAGADDVLRAGGDVRTALTGPEPTLAGLRPCHRRQSARRAACTPGGCPMLSCSGVILNWRCESPRRHSSCCWRSRGHAKKGWLPEVAGAVCGQVIQRPNTPIT